MPSYYLTCGEFALNSRATPDGKGLEMRMEFVDFLPDPDSLVVLVQATRCTQGPDLQHLTVDYPSGGAGSRDEAAWSAERWGIDAPGAERRCPAFGMEFGSIELPAWDRWMSAKGKGNPGSNGAAGRVLKRANVLMFDPAMLDDHPGRDGWEAGIAFHHEFEVVALRIARKTDNTLACSTRGVITWGYKKSETGVHTVDVPVARRRPSEAWISAANCWNSAKRPTRRVPGSALEWAA